MALSEVITCRKCGGAIRFVDLPSGKRMPVDAAFTKIYETWPATRYYLRDGTAVEGTENATEDRLTTDCYRPHFGTCERRQARTVKANVHHDSR
jgi:hypothetical protein